ncbi:MAG: MBOAT family protein [Lachnospiraceae bacterium]|nr:MBOAT family protein [Lachnospiraceae bacterium]
MLFNSLPFLIFFPIVILLYYIMPAKLRRFWLLAASYFFYMSWNPAYVLLILFSTVATYTAGRLMERREDKAYRKRVLAAVIIMNLALLFFFKYFDFALSNLNHVLGIFHLKKLESPFSLLLPVGISFYTFQSLGYAIDVYRGTVSAEKDFIDYALFVSFFPQLVAGPIERSKNLLSQVKEVSKRRLWNYDGMVSGFGMMLWGFFMKMCIADRVALLVDTVFNNIHAIGTFEALAGAAGFSVQIYADFAGYSAIAIGAARMMGFTLMENFNCPYFAESIAEFWRRWHISLSGWFRDYLYIPLGGNRKGKFRKYVNIMIVFLVSGLWHGSAWAFVLWGGLHGLYQIIGELTLPLRDKLHELLKTDRESFSFHLGKKVLTAVLAGLAWIFFRTRSLRLGLLFIRRMICHYDPWVLFDDSMYSWGLDFREVGILVFGVLLLFFVSLVREKKGCDIGNWLLTQGLVFRWLVFLGLITAVVVWGEYGIDFDSAQFIYFDF